MKKNFSGKKILLIIPSLLFLTIFPFLTLSEGINEIKEKINSQNKEIQKLNKEIKEGQKKIQILKGKKSTLQKELSFFNQQSRKYEKEISEKNQKIKVLEEEISELEKKIEENKKQIDKIKENLKKSLVFMNSFYSKSFIEIFFSSGTFSVFFSDLQAISKIQKKIQEENKKLVFWRKKLFENRKNLLDKKKTLLQEKELLSDKKILAEQNKKSKAYLLSKTKNQERYYQRLVEQRKKQAEFFNKELYKLQAQLKAYIDPKSLPKAERGFFSWPVPRKNLWISQYYGITAWRKKYAGGTPHNGLDFGVVVGTPVKAISDGVVIASGDSEKICKGVQYGKWVVVDHRNNLSSLYAHMSLVKVKKGQKVKEGDLIGYSGNTGASTGPHLHLSVFATKGLQVKTIKHRFPGKCYGKMIPVPLVAANAFVNPLSYMPKK